VLDIVDMWWHTAFSRDPDKSAAQYYHFDMDRVKWLKFFFCITDVTPETGPHCFVAGSHRRGATPNALLKQGYARLSDGDVRSHFSDDKFVEFVAPRGTIIAEDTRGLHKGKHVVHGDRLMFEIEFANSLFGGALPNERLQSVRSEKLAAVVEQYPRVYELYSAKR
jgi:ectoine hydroxylase-related dioxygenase (phytanoyl-CoA dioxygenase family)